MSMKLQCLNSLFQQVLLIAGRKKESVTLKEYKLSYKLGEDLVTLTLFNPKRMECEVVITEKDGNKKKTSVAYAQLPKNIKKTLAPLK